LTRTGGLALAGALLLFCLTGHATGAEPSRYPPTSGYDQIDNSLARARASAVHSNRLLMVVMGADWCHDSRAFIDYLDDPAFAALIAERYLVERVNVGFYDHVRGVVNHWGVPIIYGTPTVLVIEPNSNTVLNRDSLAYWRSADSLGAAAAVRYFGNFQPGPPPPAATLSARLADAFAAIDAYERRQAERLYRAYDDLGDRMRTLGDAAPDADFMERWDNVAAMRSGITADLAALREEARAQDRAGADPIRLSYPEYDLYTD
jgi:hypothetical protein